MKYTYHQGIRQAINLNYRDFIELAALIQLNYIKIIRI
jgi:hypothetical protein